MSITYEWRYTPYNWIMGWSPTPYGPCPDFHQTEIDQDFYDYDARLRMVPDKYQHYNDGVDEAFVTITSNIPDLESVDIIFDANEENVTTVPLVNGQAVIGPFTSTNWGYITIAAKDWVVFGRGGQRTVELLFTPWPSGS